MSESSKTYPRGLPFKPPDAAVSAVPETPAPASPTPSPASDVARQQVLLRRWIQILIFSTVAALTVIVGTAYVVLSQIKGQVQAARGELLTARAEPVADKTD